VGKTLFLTPLSIVDYNSNPRCFFFFCILTLFYPLLIDFLKKLNPYMMSYRDLELIIYSYLFFYKVIAVLKKFSHAHSHYGLQ
jgi:hypothetical protein